MKKQQPANVLIYAVTISIIGFVVFILFDSLGSWFIIVPVVVFLVFFSFFIFTIRSIQRDSINKSEVKKCIHCQCEMDSNIMICPNCGVDQIE